MSNAALEFTAYLQSLDIPIEGVTLFADPPTDPATQVTIQYQSNATPDQIAQGNAAISSFNWDAQQPDPAQFAAAIAADETLQPVALLLSSQYAAIQSYALNPAFIQLIWSQMIAQYGPSPGTGILTQTMITIIEGYADAAHMPLVAS